MPGTGSVVGAGSGRPGGIGLALALVAAVVGVSSAAPLVRLSESAPLVVALWRVALTAVGALVAFAAIRGRGWTWSWWSAVSGALLALHFWGWFSSLQTLSVAVSTLLVTLSPVWTALLAVVLPGERGPGARGWAGIGVALAGAVVVSGFWRAELGVDPRGVVLALGAGWLAAFYFVTSRAARRGQGLLAYALTTNVTAAGVLLVAGWTSGAALVPAAPREWGVFVLLALLPQVLGHTTLAWALRWLPAATVSVTVLLEPVGASLLAWALLGEALRGVDFAGGALILGGVVLLVTERATMEPDATSD
jgi:drug/metabolite transporter (DMT)-like permease